MKNDITETKLTTHEQLGQQYSVAGVEFIMHKWKHRTLFANIIISCWYHKITRKACSGDLRYAFADMQCPLYRVRYAVSGMRCPVCDHGYAVSDKQYPVCDPLCYTFSVVYGPLLSLFLSASLYFSLFFCILVSFSLLFLLSLLSLCLSPLCNYSCYFYCQMQHLNSFYCP